MGTKMSRRGSSRRIQGRIDLLEGDDKKRRVHLGTKKRQMLLGTCWLLCAMLMLMALRASSARDEWRARRLARSQERTRTRAYGLQVVDAAGGKACRIYSACLLGDGVWKLPRELESSMDVLESCGLAQSNVKFSDPPEDAQHFARDLFNIAIRKVRMLQGEAVTLVAAFDLMMRWKALNGTSTCVNGDTGPSACSEVEFLPAVLIDEQVLKAPDTDWRRTFVQMFTHTPMFASLLPQQEVVDSMPVCFRSIISTPMRSDAAPPALLTTDNVFYRAHNMSRENLGAEGPKCTVRVQLVQPRRSSQRFKQLSEVVSSVSSLLKKQPGDVLYDMQVLHVGLDQSLSEDVTLMQGIDVLVTAHWEFNPSMLFMHSGSSVLEVFQYGTSSNLFGGLARSLELDYFAMSSLPDGESFSNCLHEMDPDENTSSEVVGHFWEEKNSRFKLAQFDSFAAFKHRTIPRSIGRRCLSAQELVLSEPALFKFIAVHGQRKCGQGSN
mmetsp:Transcript_10158/g.31074  ORF Transcript_10158/g.31074 Transcript_10158/m.31074 type:complete len:495 (-) Transcript_10158:126-1610(-)